MSSRLRKLSKLPAAEFRALLTAAVLVFSVRVMLWTQPFERVRRLYAGTVEGRERVKGEPTANVRRIDASSEVKNVTTAVRRASRLVPVATCLTQALAARELLARRGLESRLQVGVAKKGDTLEAHAWVERDGEIIIGRVPHMERFAVLPDSALNGQFAARFN